MWEECVKSGQRVIRYSIPSLEERKTCRPGLARKGGKRIRKKVENKMKTRRLSLKYNEILEGFIYAFR